MGKLAVVLALLAGLILLPGIGVVAVIQSIVGSSTANCAPEGSTVSNAAGFGLDQMANAATIVSVGKQMNVPEQGWVVAIATAIQESGLRNLDYGDRDSLGLFQQRPSQGWGTPAQIMDPTYAATQFYQHLLDVNGWQRLSVNGAAQTVQGSGTPTAYGRHEQAAREVVGAVQGYVCTTTGTGDCNNIQAPNATAMAAINFACGQRGLPYVWGGDGPANGDAGFDCSGLTKAAYAAAGITLSRTAQTQYNAGPHVPAAQAGDLVFFGTGSSHITHVGIAISPTTMIDAPDFGKPVRIDPIGHNFVGATRPASVN